MLSTPKEEKQSIEANLTQLSERITQLKQTRDQKKDQYDKYIEECTKQKEQRQAQIAFLKNQVNFERSEKDKAIEMAEEQSNQDEDQLDKSHKDAITKLDADLDKFTKAYTKLKNDNITSENQMRQQYSRSFKNWTNTVIGYDQDLKNQERENKKSQAEYDDVQHELQEMKEHFNLLLEEKRKREELNRFMQRKKDEQSAKMNRLIRATEYIQAHWTGMIERKNWEKGPGKKKKKKKKKK